MVKKIFLQLKIGKKSFGSRRIEWVRWEGETNNILFLAQAVPTDFI
jgi:hypothetical protein